jgi:hypothetical protein
LVFKLVIQVHLQERIAITNLIARLSTRLYGEAGTFSRRAKELPQFFTKQLIILFAYCIK